MKWRGEAGFERFRRRSLEDMTARWQRIREKEEEATMRRNQLVAIATSGVLSVVPRG